MVPILFVSLRVNSGHSLSVRLRPFTYLHLFVTSSPRHDFARELVLLIPEGKQIPSSELFQSPEHFHALAG